MNEMTSLIDQLIVQVPLAGVGLYVGLLFLNKYESTVNRLVQTFEAEVRACEERYKQVFDELMNLKEKVK
jgi:hypothetical protein